MTMLFVGELQVLVDFSFCAQPERAARYQAMFGDTHAFLPVHIGIRPNTLHVILHAGTLAILTVLVVMLM